MITTSLQISEKWLYYRAPSTGQHLGLVTQNPSSNSASNTKSGRDELATHNTLGNPFCSVAVEQLTWVHVSCSLGCSCQDKAQHLHHICTASAKGQGCHLDIYL